MHLICLTCLISVCIGRCLQWYLLCRYRPVAWLNLLLQYWHAYVRLFVWISSWRHSFCAVLNLLSQKWQTSLLSPVSLKRWCPWIWRDDAYLNIFLHVWQIYRRSSVCVSWCLCKFDDRVNPLSHIWQIYRRSPVWTRLCLHRFDALEYRLLHVWQLTRCKAGEVDMSISWRNKHRLLS